MKGDHLVVLQNKNRLNTFSKLRVVVCFLSLMEQ